MSAPVYRIRSRRPLVWSTPNSLQVGVDDPVAQVTDVPDQAAPLIHALQDGISAQGFDTLRKKHRVSAAEAAGLISALRPAFAKDPSPEPHAIGLVSRSPIGGTLGTQLAGLGAEVRIESAVSDVLSGPVDTLVLVADFLLDPSWKVSLGVTDTRHLPVVFTDVGVQVGPLVRPGKTPCLSCAELWQRENPHWLGIGSQLWTTPAQHATAVASTIAAMLVGLLSGIVGLPTTCWGDENFVSLRWRAGTGEIHTVSHDFHPECRCRGL